MPNDKSFSPDITANLLEREVSPDTLLPEKRSETETSSGELLVDTSGLLEQSSGRAFRPLVSGGPIDTTLDPAEFRRLTHLRVGDDNFDRRARAQTWWDLIKGTSSQALATALGGTIENFGHLADFANPNFYRFLAKGQREFESNWLSQVGRKLQDAVREGVPVYQTTRAQEGFRPGDRTWWMGHIPSIFSSIGLIVPGGLVGKLGGMAARALRMSRAAQGGARTITASLASRHMYSSLESMELYERIYEERINRGYDDITSREIAANASGYNYISGYMNLYKDLVAWSVAFKAINYANVRLGERTRNFAAHAPRNSRASQLLRNQTSQMPPWLRASADLGKVGFAEGLEEVNIQYQKKIGERWADMITGLAPHDSRPGGVSYFLDTFQDGSVPEHLRDRHTWDSFFWGFMGGMVFGGLSKPAMRALNPTERAGYVRDIQNIEGQLLAINNSLDAYVAATESGDTQAAEMELTKIFGMVNLDALRKGTLGLNQDIYQAIIEATPEQLQEMGFGEGVQESARKALDHAAKLEASYNRHMNVERGPASQEIALRAAHVEADIEMSAELADRYEAEFQQEFEQTGIYKSLSDIGQERANLRNEELALIHAITAQEEVVTDLEGASDQLSPTEKMTLEALKENIAELKEQHAEVARRRKDADERSSRELSSGEHRRETSLVNLTPKTKGAVRPLMRAYDARSFQRIRKAELAQLLSEEGIAEINDYIQEQQRLAVEKAEKEQKQEQAEQEKAEKRAEEKEVKSQHARAVFMEQNRTKLEDLGFNEDQIASYEISDLQSAVDNNLTPSEMEQTKQANEAANQEADATQYADDLQLDPLDPSIMEELTGKKQDSSVTDTDHAKDPTPEEVKKAKEQGEQQTPDDAAVSREEETGPETEQTPTEEGFQPTAEQLDLHPKDVAPIDMEKAAKEGIEKAVKFTPMMLRQDTEMMIIDGRIYTTIPRSGVLFDAKDRPLMGPLREYIIQRMEYEYPQYVPSEKALLHGKHITLKLKDGTKRLVVDEHGGVFDPYTGRPVTDQTVRNLALIKAENDPSRRVKAGTKVTTEAGQDVGTIDTAVAVLSDNRIISLSESNMGVEIYKETSDMAASARAKRQLILDYVNGEVTEAQVAEQAEHDQTAQIGEETESESEALTEFPDETDFSEGRGHTNKLFWKSTNNPHGRSGGNDAATTFFENPDSQVEGTDIEFRVSFDNIVMKDLPPEIAQAYRDRKPIEIRGREFYIDGIRIGPDHLPAIAAHAINPDGSPIIINESPVRSFLPQPYSIKNNKRIPEKNKTAIIQKILQNRAEMYNAFISGNTVKGKISYRGSGFPITERVDNAPAQNNVLQYIEESGITPRFGVLNRESYPVDVQGEFLMEVDGQPGNFIMFIPGFEGRLYPHKLNVRKISPREAGMAYSLVKGYLTGQVDLGTMITPEMSSVLHGITVGEFFNLLVFHGRDATNIYTKNPTDYNRGRTMYFDTVGGRRVFQLGDKRYTAENIEGAEKEIPTHLVNHKNRQVDKRGLGDNHSLANVLGRSEPFVWFGREIDPSVPNSYLEFMFQGEVPAVTTDAKAATPPLVQPNIHFEAEMDTVTSTAFFVEGEAMPHYPEYDNNKREGQKGYTKRRVARLITDTPGYSYVYGKDVTIEGFEEFGFFLTDEFGAWDVKEVSSGQTIATASTQAAAIEAATERLNETGIDTFRKALKAKPSVYGPESRNAEAKLEAEQAKLDEKHGDKVNKYKPIKPKRFKSGPPRKSNYDTDIQQEIDKVKAILPPGVPINIDPNIDIVAKHAGHENPSQVWGMFAHGMIFMHENAPEGTAYHEAFHAVFNLSLTQETRNKILAEAEGRYRQRYNKKHETELQLEEFLADEFGHYMLREGAYSVGKETDGFFQRIWQWIKEVFSNKSRIDRLFRQIESGSFAQATRYSSEFAQNLSPRYKDASDVFTPTIKDAMVRTLAFQIAEHANYQLSDDLSNIDLSIVPNIIVGLYQDYRDVGDIKRADLWARALDEGTLDKMVEGVDEFFARLGLRGKKYQEVSLDTLLEGETEGLDQNTREASKERLFIPTAYEYSNWDRAGANVRLMVAMLPRLKSANRKTDGTYDYAYNEVTGEPEFVDASRVWNILLQRLANITTSGKTTKWENLMLAVRDAAAYEPALNILADKLEGAEVPQNKKNEFFNVFGNLTTMNFHTMIYGERTDITLFDETHPFNVAVFESDLYRQGRKTATNWRSMFRADYFNPVGNTYKLDSSLLSSAVSDYREISNRMKDGFKRTQIPELVEVLNRVGIEMDQVSLEHFFDREASVEGAVKRLLDHADTIFFTSGRNHTSFADMLKLAQNPKQDHMELFKGQNPMSSRALYSLAEIFYEHNPGLSEGTILSVEGKSKWLYSDTNFYFEEFSKLKNDAEYRELRKKERMTNNLLILRSLSDPTLRSDMEYTAVDNVKSRRENDGGRDYVDSLPYEKFVLKYSSILRGKAPAINFSDKKTSLQLAGIPIDRLAVRIRTNKALRNINKDLPEATNPVDALLGSVEISESLVDMFTGYMESEIQRVYQVQQDQDTLTQDQMIREYHYRMDREGNVNFQDARGRQFVLFPGLSKQRLQETNPQLHDLMYGEGNLVNPYSVETRALLRREAQGLLQQALRNEVRQLRNERILNERGEFQSHLIDFNYLKYTYDTNLSADMKAELRGIHREASSVATAALYGLAMNIEQTLLFHGDPAFFANFDTLRKRTSGPIAFRRSLNIADPQVPAFYTMAVAQDIYTSSEYMNDLKDSLKGVVNPTRLKKILKPYERINTTDAQALITLDRAVQILRGEGRWLTEFDSVLEKWKAGNVDVINTKTGKRMMKLFLTPFKGVHYGIERTNPDSNLRNPVYLKYSQLVLLPGMLKQSPNLQKVYDAMIRDGVQELVFESGVKVGQRASRNISDFDNITLVPNTLSNENWGRQVETPTHGVSEKGLDGTQVRRNILLGLRQGRTYNEGRSHFEVENEYMATVNEMARRGLENLETEMGIEVNASGVGRIGRMEKFSQMMKEESSKRNAPNNIREAFDMIDNHMRVELELNPKPKQAESIFMSLYKRNVIRQDVFGGSFVQASSYGFKSYAALTPEQQQAVQEGVVPETEKAPRLDGLRPPMMVDGKVQAAQVLAPSWFGQVVADAYKGKSPSQLTRQEIREFFNESPELLKFIGYRIPNQALASIENLEVVGFLPSDMGDTMVVYEELTVKNDSDFDVDKMYGLMPQFKIVKGKPVLYEFYENTGSKKQLRQIYDDRYESHHRLRQKLTKLDRVLSKETQGLTRDEIIASESRVDFNTREESWIIDGIPEEMLDAQRERLFDVPTVQQFIEQNLGKDAYQVNSDQAIWNKRILLMREIMENPEVLAESLTPITDEALVEQAKDMAEQIGTDQAYEGIMEFLPSSQIEIGKRFHSGQKLIGILANHATSHAIATRTGLGFKGSWIAYAFAKEKSLIKRKKGPPIPIAYMNTYEDRGGQQIMEQISTMMSGFLDATSDSWALALNLNDDTANIAAAMLRLGAGWGSTLAFLNQPVVRELGTLKPLVRGRIVSLKGLTPETHLMRHYTQQVAKAIAGKSYTQAKQSDIIKEALDQKQIQAKPLNVLLSESNLKNMLRGDQTPQYYYDQAQILGAFNEIDKYSSSLANFVSSTKFDVDMPASIAELVVNELRLSEAFDSGTLLTDGYIENTFLHQFSQAYNSARAVTAGLHIGRSSLGRALMNRVLYDVGEGFRTGRDVDTINQVHQALTTYVIQAYDSIVDHKKGLSVTNPVYRTPDVMKQMFYGDNTMVRRLIKIKKIIPKGENPLVDYLQPNLEANRPDFIETSYREKGSLFTDKLIQGWEALLVHEDHTVRRFGRDLLPYAYATSGMRRGMNTLHDLIPSEMLTEVSTFFRKWKQGYQFNADNRSAMADAIAREVFRNEYNNELLVPEISVKKLPQNIRKAYRPFTVEGVTKHVVVGFDVPLDLLPTSERPNKLTGERETSFPEVIRVEGNLYRAVTDIYMDEKSKQPRVSYGLLQKKGYHDGTFHIYEYFNPDASSIIEQNAVPESVPFDQDFTQDRMELQDLMVPIEDGSKQQFTMESILRKPIC